jgi:hypothetical protein
MSEKQAMTPADEIEVKLAAEATRKMKAGKKPTREESTALRKWQKKKEEQDRWRYYATIPQKHYIELSGRPRRVLADHAARFGLPYIGATVNLSDLLKALHHFLETNGRKIASGEVPNQDVGEASIPADATQAQRLDWASRQTAAIFRKCLASGNHAAALRAARQIVQLGNLANGITGEKSNDPADEFFND